MNLGDAEESIDFLKRFHPEGLWVLTSIRPDRKAIDTKTFSLESEAGAREWLNKYLQERNIYFSVNPTIRPVNKKAERDDIKELAWLHVDVDPRAGEDINEERERALDLLQNPPKGTPKPTCIIFSGGGYQGFWKLEKPLPINGEEELYEDAKRYNQQLEMIFGADNCHNVDRIMRLPGTINIPDARKLKKGRTKTQATLVEFDDSLVYPIEEFVQAAMVQLPDSGIGTGSGGGAKVEVSGNVARLGSVEELDEWSVPDRVRVAIVQGNDPDNPKIGDNSRSSWLFDVCCQLVRCAVPDDVIYSIITDPDFLISESVLAAGSNAKRYAVRQIERAKEEAENTWIRILNERHAVIRNMGGRCLVIEEQEDLILNRHKLTKQTVTDFKNSYINVKVDVLDKKGNPAKKPLGSYWFEHEMRRQYDFLIFSPGRDIPGAYNLWKGFGCEAREGDCSLYLDHMREVLCNNDQELYDYLINWMARAVQRPGSPGHTAIVLRGEEGTGKGFFVKQFGSLWGRHYMQVSDPKHLVGNFNAHLRDCSVLFADEAFYAGDKRHESVLKQLITEEIIAIESKGIDIETFANYVHLLMASNSDWVVPAGRTARRFVVLDVTSKHKRDVSYFKTISDQLNSGGREALLHHLMNHDISEFNVQEFPETVGLQDQKIHSLNPEEEWWYQKLNDGSTPDEILKQSLVDEYVEYARAFNVTRRGNMTALGLFLNKVCPGEWPLTKKRIIKEQVDAGHFESKARPFYFFPRLADLRAQWEALYGTTSWPKEAPVEPESEMEIPF